MLFYIHFMVFMPGEPHSNQHQGFQKAPRVKISCSAVNQEESKNNLFAKKNFSCCAFFVFSSKSSSFNRRPPYCSVSAVAGPLASVCVAVASRMFSPLSFFFFFCFQGAFKSSLLQLLPLFCHKWKDADCLWNCENDWQCFWLEPGKMDWRDFRVETSGIRQTSQH